MSSMGQATCSAKYEIGCIQVLFLKNTFSEYENKHVDITVHSVIAIPICCAYLVVFPHILGKPTCSAATALLP